MYRKVLIKNGSVLLPDGPKVADIELSGEIIAHIDRHLPAGRSSTVIDAEGKYVLPGFIDIHTNGIGGFDLTKGVYDSEGGSFVSSEETYMKGLDEALRKYAGTGVTRAVLTSLASPISELQRVFSYVNKYRNKSQKHAWGDVLAGLYVEGTFMKRAEYRGAHNPEYFNEPSIELYDRLQSAAGRLIRIVNVVPEWGSSALDLIKYLTEKGIVCAAGHSGATGVEYARAVANGTRLAVHFLNGPTGSSTKPFDGGGAVESVLRDDNVCAEIIADGYHVDKSYVMDTIKRKGFDEVVVITDSMFPTLLEGLQTFSMLGVEGKVSSNGQYLQIADRGNALFGSTLTMDKAFSNILNWLTEPIEGVWYRRHEPLSFEEALSKASSVCSRNPARTLGIFEPKESKVMDSLKGYTGSIEIGKSADLIVADIEKTQGKQHVEVNKVFVKGHLI